ncbi:MAG: hypothetical protein MUC44_05265 [Beijerinckiaceae bacterium]|jgi:hypothetical protein|nr:hypothetical protein [Beijerinckiaceae bacterium]
MIKRNSGQVQHVRQGMMAAALLITMATPAAAQAVDPALATPCLQSLKAEQVKNPPKPKKANAGKVIGVLIGGLVGRGLGEIVCERGDTTCKVGMTVAGGAGGFALGKGIDKRQERKIAEASYAASITGQPAGVTFEKSCALVEPLSTTSFEKRTVEIALAPGIAPPSTLRTIAEYNATAAKGAVALVASPNGAGKTGVSVAAGTPLFVMGSVNNGQHLLIADGNLDLGYAARGYVPAKGWAKVVAPENPLLVMGAPPSQPLAAQINAEVPCWMERVVVRDESKKKSSQTSNDLKVCRYPDGSIAPDVSQS